MEFLTIPYITRTPPAVIRIDRTTTIITITRTRAAIRRIIPITTSKQGNRPATQKFAVRFIKQQLCVNLKAHTHPARRYPHRPHHDHYDHYENESRNAEKKQPNYHQQARHNFHHITDL